MSASLFSGPSEKMSFSNLIRELLSKVGELISTQLELTKAEIKLESRKLVLAIALGAGAAAIGFVFLLFFGLSLLLVLAQFMDVMWASLATSGFYLLMTALLAGGMILEIRKKSESMSID